MMNLAIFLAMFLIMDIDCNDVKSSKGADKGDPFTWLLLNQIQKIDSTLEKLQERDNKLEKEIRKQQSEFFSKVGRIENQIVQLSNKISGVSNQDEIQAVRKKLAALENFAKTHLTATELAISQTEQNDQLEKKLEKIRKQQSKSVSKVASIEGQITQVSNRIPGLTNKREVEAIKNKLAALETSARAHLTATELASSQKELKDQLEKKLETEIHKQESESISRAALIKNQIVQLSNNITGLASRGEVHVVKTKLAALETVARAHLTSRDLITTQRELSSLKGKVYNLERQVKELECPYGQKKWQGSCYYFGLGLVTWPQARDKCTSLGGHLVKIESAAENRMLFTEAINAGLTSRDVWMGANDISTEGTWRWVSDNSPVQYLIWYTGEPNNRGNQDCGKLYLYHNFRWDDCGCYYKGHYICEKEL